MAVTFDEGKRQSTITQRGLDMARAGIVFAGATLSVENARRHYGETRFITIGRLDGRMVVVVWTPRAGDHRNISMRKANDREQQHYGGRLD